METIDAAKQAFEKKFQSTSFIRSISIKKRANTSYIQVCINSKDDIAKIEKLLTNGKWWGYEVEIVVSLRT